MKPPSLTAPNRYEAWRGLSGAAVFADGCLVGLVCQALERFSAQRLWFTPIQRALAACPLLPSTDMSVVPSGDLRSNIEPRINDNPAALLNARHAVVPFAEAVRADELRFLENFCGGSAFIDLAIFTGPGGSGKTRLLAEYCLRRRVQNWRAGFLDVGEQALATVLALLRVSRTPTVVTIDYAESRPKLAEELESIIEAAKYAQGKTGSKVRIVLLARTAGDWWEYLRGRAGALSDLLLGKIPFALTPISVPSAQRQPLFDQAVAAFSRLRGKSLSPTAPELEEPLFERILYVHMAALAQVDGLRLSASELLGGICRHEQRFWREYAAPQHPSDDDLAELETAAARLVAAITLRGGSGSLDDAVQLGASVKGPEHGFIKFLHRRLYSGRSDVDPLSAYLAPLEPDLLGEAMVIDVLRSQVNASTFLEQVFTGSEMARLRNGFIVLGRIAMEHADVGVPWLRQLLDANVGQRAIPAFEAALALGDKSAFVPLGDVIADAMRREGNVAIAAHFDERIPHPTVGMGELAAWAMLDLVKSNGLGTGDTILAERSARLCKLGYRLGELGQRDAALDAMREAVEICRQLAQTRPDEFLSNLGIALYNLGVMLSKVGQREAALEATREAVEICHQLVAMGPDALPPDLAKGIGNLGLRLSEVGQSQEALKVTLDTLQIYRGLAEIWPDAFLPDLVRSLNNLGVMLSAAGRQEAALDATREALRICRQLADTRPDAFLPDLARNLNNMGAMLSVAGQQEAALDATREALRICRQLADTRPDAFLPDLATSLNNMGQMFNELGQREAALKVAREAVQIYRRCAQTSPDAFLPKLATGLVNLSNLFSKLGQQEAALEATREVVQVRRLLVEAGPEAFLPDLATSLFKLGMLFSELGQQKEALEVTREAVQIFRQLVETRPDEFLPDLATSLNNMGNLLDELGQQKEALEVTREAVQIFRQLVETRPDSFLRDLAISLNTLGANLGKLGQREAAITAKCEAVQILRPLAETRPDAFLLDLARGLYNLGTEFGRACPFGRRA